MKKNKSKKCKNPFVFNEEALRKWCYENFETNSKYDKILGEYVIDISACTTIFMYFLEFSEKLSFDNSIPINTVLYDLIYPYVRKYAEIWRNLYNSNIPKKIQDQMWRDIMLNSVKD